MSAHQSTVATLQPRGRAVTRESWLSVRAWLAAAGALLLPALLFTWLLSGDSRQNRVLSLPVQHFYIVTLVSLLAVGVAVLVARAALRMEQYRVVLIAVGFVSLAGFFSVHGLATPGMGLESGYSYGGTTGSAVGYASDDYGSAYAHAGHGAGAGGLDYGGTVVGLSAYLSLALPSLFFAAAYTPPPARRGRRLSARLLALMALLVLTGYAGLALWQPGLVAELPLSRPPYSYAMAGASVLLLGYAAWQQVRTYARTHLPAHGALALAFPLLAEAQVVMVVAPFWSLAWWGYHTLMLAAVVLALGALFLELDRRRGLERFLAPELVERVVAGDLLRLTGTRRVVTVLFADLRGSTALAERLPPEEVVELVNAYVGAMARPVLEQGGMLDKFTGDGLMAIFGAVGDEHGTQGALAAARAVGRMRLAVQQLNQQRVAQGGEPLHFGVGFHTGEVVLGAIGLPQRADLTAIGDTANTASRLEGLCKELGVDVVLSRETAERLTGREDVVLRELGRAEVRGKREPMQLFTLA